MGRARDRVRKSRKKFRDAQPSPQVIERVRPFTADVTGPDDEEEWAVAAAIVWEEAHRALRAWAREYVFLVPYRASLIREVDKAADNVVKHWFCDHRSANEGEFFVEYCDFGCWDLADLARKTGGWEDYNSWRSEGLFRPAWGRVWSRCLRLGLPWEDLGFVAPGV